MSTRNGKKGSQRVNHEPKSNDTSFPSSEEKSTLFSRSQYSLDLVNSWINGADTKVSISCGIFSVVIAVIVFLADRNLSSYIIGQSIVADGGSTLVMGMQAHDLMSILSQ